MHLALNIPPGEQHFQGNYSGTQSSPCKNQSNEIFYTLLQST
jgi:hypothetical protein